MLPGKKIGETNFPGIFPLQVSKLIQKQFWRRISFWPLIVINPVKIKIVLVLKHQYLWTKITFGSAEDEFCPCGVGRARHQMPVHMLGCA